MLCPKCNTNNSEGASFCLNCGTDLRVSTAPSTLIDSAQEQQQDTVVQQMQYEEQKNIESVQSTVDLDRGVQPNYSETKNETNGNPVQLNKRKNKFKIPGIICIILVLIVVCTIYFLKNNRDIIQIEEDQSIGLFFLPKDKTHERYALFNSDGKQLTDFVYSGRGEDNDDNYNGFEYGFTFARNEEKNTVEMIDRNGKVIYENPNITSWNYKFYFTGSYSEPKKVYNYKNKFITELPADTSKYSLKIAVDYLMVVYKDSYIIYNIEGKVVKKGKIKNEENFENKLVSEQGYLAASVGGKIYLFAPNEKLISEFDSESNYCLSEVGNMNNDILFHKCNTRLKDGKKIISGGKVYDLQDDWMGLVYCGNETIGDQGFDKQFLLTKDYKIKKKLPSEIQLFDSNNYVTKNDRKIEFYKGDKLVNTIDSNGLSIENFCAVNGYTLYDRKNAVYYVYNKDGKQIFDKPINSQVFINNDIYYKFKTNDGKFYYTNEKGSKIAGEYNNIKILNNNVIEDWHKNFENLSSSRRNSYLFQNHSLNDLYFLVTIGNSTQILNKNEEVVFECTDCSSNTYKLRKHFGNEYVLVYGKKNTLMMDLSTKKVIAEGYTLFDHRGYIETSLYDSENNYISKYYTYEGKLFHEVK